MDRLPNEWIIIILEYAVNQENSLFDLDECLDSAEYISRGVKLAGECLDHEQFDLIRYMCMAVSAGDEDIKYVRQRREAKAIRQSRLEHMEGQGTASEIKAQKKRARKSTGNVRYTLRPKKRICYAETRTRRSRTLRNNGARWFFWELADDTERLHLLDWRLINGTCKRFRHLGKRVFFSARTFLMDLFTLENLATRRLDGLSREGQKTATTYNKSIILKKPAWDTIRSRLPFIGLYQSLRRLRLYFMIVTTVAIITLVWSNLM